ncbi:protein kinase domain-containing protein [Actinomadura algeriensis]|uniref:non-specific serine/threonine protein kinase n=1 Tax=Actinomadura algeriensis TaxID=1679523 RepID=A0ABR9K4V3_9ACTN|nr:cellulose binding domain-containing protein [Actinomadura algeriensis]MBE1537733.1 serine/threonine-protein kinase [Actinomadura algeriensis]
MPETVGPGDLPGERYRIEALLGTGGMAAVWRAHDLVLDRAVAVKVPREGWPEEFPRRLRREARAAAGLSHPNITGVYDYGEHRGVPYVVMELLDGESLADRLARGPLPWREAAAVCAAIGDALDAAHAAGIVHRDIKPANVFQTPVAVKVLDFGIAFTGPDPAGGPVLGTPAYTAPELLDGAPPSPAADVFSLGVVLRQALTGGPPEPAGAPAPGGLPGDVPAEIAGLCARCADPRPGVRPAAAEAARALADAAGVQLLRVVPEDAPGTTRDAPREPRAHDRTRVLHDPLPAPQTAAPPAADEPAAPDGGAPASPRKPLVIAVAAAGLVALVAVLLATLSPDEPPPGAPPAGPSDGPAAVAGGAPCEVAYRVDGTWPAGFQATVRITNLGDGPIDGWRLGFDLPDGQAVTQLWNGTPAQDGAAVTVTPAGWNRSIPAGGTVEFGFLGSSDGTDGDATAPEGFTLNGSSCR